MGGWTEGNAAKRVVGVSTTPTLSSASPPLHLIQPVRSAIARFPATRYYGSKRKLLGWMYSHLSPIRFDSVLDAFGGTGSVSLLFKAMRKRVTYHDGLLFNEDVGRTVLADRPALGRADVEAILSGIQPRAGVVSQHFSGIFFKEDENAWLDGFANQLNKIQSADERALLRYLIYQACLKKRPFNLFHRANLKLRTNQAVPRSFGNAVTWERSFTHHALQAYDDLARTHLELGSSVSILPSGSAENIAPGYDLVYIDPPYISCEERYNRDDYWRRYNFLEGLARYEQWSGLINFSSDIRLFDPPAWFVDWGRAHSFKDRLFSFIDAHQRSIVVLSYVSDAIPTEAEIKSHFESRFFQVSIHSSEHNHALSRVRKREILFIGYPRP